MIEGQSNQLEVYFFFSAKVNGIHTIVATMPDIRWAKNDLLRITARM